MLISKNVTIASLQEKGVTFDNERIIALFKNAGLCRKEETGSPIFTPTRDIQELMGLTGNTSLSGLTCVQRFCAFLEVLAAGADMRYDQELWQSLAHQRGIDDPQPDPLTLLRSSRLPVQSTTEREINKQLVQDLRVPRALMRHLQRQLTAEGITVSEKTQALFAALSQPQELVQVTAHNAGCDR